MLTPTARFGAMVLIGFLAPLATSCDTERFGAAPSGQLLQNLRAQPASAFADDVSLVTVYVHVPVTDSVNPRQVIFNTTAGVFIASDSSTLTLVAPDTSALAPLLRAPSQAAVATISAAAADTVLSTTVTFLQAPPDTVLLEPSAFIFSADSARELALTAILRRTTGFVSSGIFLRFSAPVGNFGATTASNDSGIVHVRYSPGIVTDTLADTIRATAYLNGSQVATGATVVILLP